MHEAGMYVLAATQSLAVAAAKEPLPTVGTMELFVLLILTCISAVALWEAGKALGGWAYPRLFGSKRERKMRKLKELARIAAQAEIEKWMDEDDVPSSERVLQASRQRALTTAASGSTGPRSTTPLPSPTTESSPRSPTTTTRPTAPMNMGESRESTFGEIRPATPPLPERGQSVPISGQFDRERVVQDALGLMTVQHLRDGLASEGLPVSGVKSDLTRRLGGQLGDEPPPAHLPTTRQLRYVLWTWRHFELAGRTQILWVNLATRSAVSDWLARWNRG